MTTFAKCVGLQLQCNFVVVVVLSLVKTCVYVTGLTVCVTKVLHLHITH